MTSEIPPYPAKESIEETLRKQAMQHLIDAVEAGQAMRKLQREYFRTRSQQALIDSKNAEKIFDNFADNAMQKVRDL